MESETAGIRDAFKLQPVGPDGSALELPISPAQARSYRIKIYILSAIGFFSTLWSVRMPGVPTESLLVGIFAWACVIYARLRRSNGRGGLWIGAAFVLCVALCFSDMPFRLALWVSAPSLKREAHALLEQSEHRLDDEHHPHKYFGVFPIERVALGESFQRVDRSVVVFTFDKKEFPWVHNGLYYSEQPLLERNPNDRDGLHHLFGPWYSWRYTGW